LIITTSQHHLINKQKGIGCAKGIEVPRYSLKIGRGNIVEKYGKA
jgi:hypothetical protein